MARQTTVQCVVCATPILPEPGDGEGSTVPLRRRYCSNACRQRAYRHRQSERSAVPPWSRHRLGHAGGVPITLDSFVGRTRELHKLDRLNAAPVTTIVGPPGVGKSRTALRFVETRPATWAGGVWWIDLDRVQRGADLATVAASVIRMSTPDAEGVGLGGAGPARPGAAAAPDGMSADAGPRILAPLRRRALIVLDNCGQRIEECAWLVERLLVEGGPSLRVLVTSQEAIRIPGERVFRLGPLSLPSRADRRDPRAVLCSDAVRLFIDRASASDPEFVLSKFNSAAVASVCIAVDGLPLYLELAARRIGLVSAIELADGLSRPMAVLTVGSRTAPPRQSSFRASLDASYDLLDERAKALLRRMSVLSGSFGLDAVMALGADVLGGQSDALDVLARLRSVSLLEGHQDGVGETADGVKSFSLLNTVGAYARERLKAEPDPDASWDRLLSWLVAVFSPSLGRVVTCPRLDAKLEMMSGTVLGAARWARERRDARWVPLAAILARHRRSEDHTTLVVAAMDAEVAGLDGDRWRVAALIEGAAALGLTGDLDGALRRAADAVALATRITERATGTPDRGVCAGDVAQRARALLELAACQDAAGQAQAAALSVECALDAARRSGQSDGVAICLGRLAQTRLSAGDASAAGKLATDALGLLGGHRLDELTAYLLDIRCRAALAVGDLRAAGRDAVQCLHLVPVDPDYVRSPLLSLAVVEAESGNLTRALRLAELARALGASADPDHRLHRSLGHCSRSEILEARRTASRLSASAARAFALDGRWPTEPAREAGATVSDRQREVAALVAAGLTNRQIASRLSISLRTVAVDLAQLRAVLGIRSRVQVAAWANLGRPGPNPARAISS
jgi:predicted ATPase/DNA-binding CsgD family transcriptional regulator